MWLRRPYSGPSVNDFFQPSCRFPSGLQVQLCQPPSVITLARVSRYDNGRVLVGVICVSFFVRSVFTVVGSQGTKKPGSSTWLPRILCRALVQPQGPQAHAFGNLHNRSRGRDQIRSKHCIGQCASTSWVEFRISMGLFPAALFPRDMGDNFYCYHCGHHDSTTGRLRARMAHAGDLPAPQSSVQKIILRTGLRVVNVHRAVFCFLVHKKYAVRNLGMS